MGILRWIVGVFGVAREQYRINQKITSMAEAPLKLDAEEVIGEYLGILAHIEEHCPGFCDSGTSPADCIGSLFALVRRELPGFLPPHGPVPDPLRAEVESLRLERDEDIRRIVELTAERDTLRIELSRMTTACKDAESMLGAARDQRDYARQERDEARAATANYQQIARDISAERDRAIAARVAAVDRAKKALAQALEGVDV